MRGAASPAATQRAPSVAASAAVKELALVATLGAAAGAGRLLFAPIPSVQPVTVICLVSGAALGPRAGLAVGPVAVLVSNSFLGHGPWTLAQMMLWALAGLTGALARPLARRALGLAALGVLWAFAFGWGTNLWLLTVFGPEVSLEALLLLGARSVPFDVAHAVGNVILALVAGPSLVRLLERYGRRIRVEVEWEDAPAAS